VEEQMAEARLVTLANQSFAGQVVTQGREERPVYASLCVAAA
jgi:hypothetical protein